MSACCENCKFLFPQHAGPPVCRRYPPQLIMALAPFRNAMGRMEDKPQLQSSLPPVPLEFWCGEYQEGSRIVVASATTKPVGVM